MDDVAEQPVVRPHDWKPIQLFGTRFCTIFFIVFFLPFPFTGMLDACGFSDASNAVADIFNRMWMPVDSFFATHLFHQLGPLSYADTGSGDKLFDYLTLFGILLLASV